MSDYFYVLNCIFSDESCDECGLDCYLCPYYDEEEEDYE